MISRSGSRHGVLARRLQASALALVVVTTWALCHPYRGIDHDARLYVLQALARLHPGTLGVDVFLRDGSQDRFTILSPLAAAAFRWLGIEPAAALLTFLFQLGIIAAAWALARTVTTAGKAALGVGVLIALPGDYGADRIFACLESFLTPRMAAEALVLAGLAAALRGRMALALASTAAALLLHPLMGLAGAVALLLHRLGRRHPVILAALAIVGIKALVLLAVFMPPGLGGRFDPAWLAWVQARSPYVFLAHWSLGDFTRLAVTLATLGLAWQVLRDARARTLAALAAITTAAGILLTLIACDLLHLALFTQLQPWRWQWLGTVVAALLLPALIAELWNGAPAGHAANGRAAAWLVIAAWLFTPTPYALIPAAAALAAPRYLPRFAPNEVRWLRAGAVALLLMAVTWRLATNLTFTDAHYADLTLPLWVRRLASFCHDGAAPIALMALIAWAPRALQRRVQLPVDDVANAMAPRNVRTLDRSATAAATAATLSCAAMALGLAALGSAATLPYAWRSWTAREFTPADADRFAQFRELIPPAAQVFWPESTLAVWMMLERPSYLSVAQTAGVLFSRPSAAELNRRTRVLGSAGIGDAFMTWNTGGGNLRLTPEQLAAACATQDFDYLVTATDIGIVPLATAPSAHNAATVSTDNPIRLYRCRTPHAP